MEFYRKYPEETENNHSFYFKHLDNGGQISSTIKAVLKGRSVLNASVNMQRQDGNRRNSFNFFKNEAPEYAGNMEFQIQIKNEKHGN